MKGKREGRREGKEGKKRNRNMEINPGLPSFMSGRHFGEVSLNHTDKKRMSGEKYPQIRSYII
jgi:hypothetical protein